MTGRPRDDSGRSVALDIADEAGFEVQSQGHDARQDLVRKGIIAAPYVDSDDDEDVALERKLMEFAHKEVDPAVSLRVAKGRQLLAESGILDDLVQMRQAHKPRPSTAAHTLPPRTLVARPDSAVHSQRPASRTTSRRLPAHVVRRRKISPLYNRTVEENGERDPRFTEESARRLTTPLPRSVRHSGQHSLKQSTLFELDESVYTGHAFAGALHNIRPASAPPERVRLDMGALRAFNEAVQRGERPSFTHEERELFGEEVLSEDDAQTSKSPTRTRTGLSSIDLLTAPEFEHIPIDRLIPSLFGNDVLQRPHRGLLELASKKLIEGKHAKSMKGAMHKLTDDWTWRRGQWNSRSWSVFGADSKKDSLWFGRKGKGIAAMVKGPVTNPPVDFELETMMKRFGTPFRHKMWTSMGIRSPEEIMAVGNKDFENMGFSEFDRKLLRREAAKIVALGDRSTRIRRRLVAAISKHVQDDATLFVQQLRGMFLACGGADNKVAASSVFTSLHDGGIIDSSLLRESAFVTSQGNAPASTSLHSSHVHTYFSSEAYAHSSQQALSPTMGATRDGFFELHGADAEMSLHEFLQMLWVVESAPGSNSFSFQVPPVPDPQHELTAIRKATQEFYLTPRSPARNLGIGATQASNMSHHQEHLYDPILPGSPQALEASYTRIQEQDNGGSANGAGDTNQGAPWLDTSKLCVFVEACNTVRDQGRPCISLRGTGQRYPALALQVVQAVEQLQLEAPAFVDSNVMDHKGLVSAAARRGAPEWAAKFSRSLKLTDGSWPKFPRFGSFEVWALLPGKAEPQCVFSKIKEKRFPSKNEVISRIADALQAKLENVAPMCEYVAPPKKDRLCTHCEMGKVLDNQCNWCGSIQLERRGRMGTSHRGA